MNEGERFGVSHQLKNSLRADPLFPYSRGKEASAKRRS